MVRTALAQLQRWREQAEPLGVSVNISRYDVTQIDEVVNALQGVESDSVTFEIRRSVFDIDADANYLQLTRLSAAGARVTLDDVGLQDAPARALAATIDEIKIARRRLPQWNIRQQGRFQSLIDSRVATV